MKPLWLRLLPYAVAVAAVFALLLACFSFGVHVERQRRVAEVAELKRVHEGVLAKIDNTNREELAKAQQAARDAEQAAAQRIAELDAKHWKEMQDAKTRSDADIAAVRAGAWRVREQYTCPGAGSAAGGVPQAGSSAGMGDAATGRGLGPEDAAAILDTADTGDGWAEQLKACQAIIRADRGQ